MVYKNNCFLGIRTTEDKMTTRKYISKPAYEEFIRQTKRATRKGEHKVKQDLTECGWTFEERRTTVLIGRPLIPSGRKRRTCIEASKVLNAILGKRKEPEQTEIPFPQTEPTSEPEPETSIIKSEVIQLPISPDQIVDIVALKNNQGVLFTVVAKTCEVLDIGANNQIARIRERDDWLSADIRLQLPGDTQSRAVFCIAVEFYEAWLNSINRNKVAERARPALIKLQTECTKAIRNWFHPEAPQATEAPQESPLLAFIAEMREDRRIILRLLDRVTLINPAPQQQTNFEDVIVDAARTAAEVAVSVAEIVTDGAIYIRPGIYDYRGRPAYTSWKALEIAVQHLNALFAEKTPDLPSLNHYFEKYGYDLGDLTVPRFNQLASIRKSINRNEMPLALKHLQDRHKAPPENRLWSDDHINLVVNVMELWCGIGCPEHGHKVDNGRWMWDEKLAVKKLVKVGVDLTKYGAVTIEEMVARVTSYAKLMQQGLVP